jgi:outer membrane protein assembly factor BamB
MFFASELKSEKKIPVLELAWVSDSLFKTPESVLWDSKNKVIYVSNLNLNPRLKDGNGSIGKINSKGQVINAEWVTGLSSPKGMTLVGHLLWVADVDELVCIDINTGKIIKKILVPNAKMLNDITSDKNGVIYFSDTDGNAVYKFKNDSISLITNQGLSAPNGLLFDSGRLLLASAGSTDFAELNMDTGAKTIIAKGVNKGDGIAKINKNQYIVSDWFGELFYISPIGTRHSLIKTSDSKINTADIDYIKSDNLLVVPTFFHNRIMAYKLK